MWPTKEKIKGQFSWRGLTHTNLVRMEFKILPTTLKEKHLSNLLAVADAKELD